MKKAVLCGLALCLSCAAIAYAGENQFSLGLQGGLVNSSTSIKGGSIRFYEYTYDQDRSFDVLGIGPYFRYMHAFNNKLLAGVQGSFQHIDVNKTFKWTDDAVGTTTDTFSIDARTFYSLSAVLGYQVANNVQFIVFGGPAWLRTKYKTRDVENNIEAQTTKKTMLVGDIGLGVNWQIAKHWQAGFNGRYVFETDRRTVASTAEYDVETPTTAATRLMMLELSVGYTF